MTTSAAVLMPLQTAYKEVQTVIQTATRNKTSDAEAVWKIAAKDTVADDKVSQAPTATKPTTSEIGTQTEVETGMQAVETLDQSLKDTRIKAMTGIIETSLSNFKQHMENSASMHSQRINEEL